MDPNSQTRSCPHPVLERDGPVDKEELIKICKELDIEYDDGPVAELIQEADEKDGKIELADFKTAVLRDEG